MRSVVSGMLLAFVWAKCISAQDGVLPSLDPTKDISQYVHDFWTIEDGLPSNTIFDIVQDRDGYLWLATDNGLTRFDGVRFTTYNTLNTPVMRSNLIKDLHLGPDGSLWAGSGGGLLRHSEGRFECFTTDDGLSNDHITDIAEDRSGALWIVTADKKLHQFRSGDISAIGMPSNIAPTISNLDVDGLGTVWFAAGVSGIYRYKDGQFDTTSIPAASSKSRFLSVLIDRAGTVWAGTGVGTGKLYQLESDNWEVIDLPGQPGMEQEFANYVLYEDRNGTLWSGGGALHRIAEDVLDVWTVADGLPDPRVRAIHEDREGNLWVGIYGGGLVRLKTGRITHYNVPNIPNQEGQSLHSVYRSHDGNLWAGSNLGLMRFDDGRFQVVVPNDGRRLGTVWSMAGDSNGDLWLGSDIGLVRYSEGSTTLYSTRNGLPATEVLLVYADQESGLWLVPRKGGLARFEGGVFTPIPELGDKGIRAIHEDRNGTVWLGAANGRVFYSRGEQFAPLTDPGSYGIKCFHEDEEGTLWVGTWGGGLLRLRENRLTAYTQKDGLCADTTSWILEDDQYNLWVSSDQGIYRVNRKQIEDYDAGRIDKIPCTAYGIDDGLNNLETSSLGFPSGSKTSDGWLWFTMQPGIAAVGPEEIENPLPPPVLIEEILVAGRAIVGDELEAIDPDRRDLELHFTATSLRAPEKVRFKYQLEGYDDDWVEAGDRRVAYYTGIPPGSYQFHVKAANDSGVWNEQGAMTSLTFLPYFYETWWFRLLLGLFLGALLLTAHRRRTKRIQTRNLELECLVRKREQAELGLRSALSQIKKLQKSLEQENVYLREEVHKTHSGFHEIIGESDGLEKVLHKVEQVAATETTVLILGETGTGKELIARAIHQRSLRKDRPLITVNPSALPSTLIESELFGHEKGAFTGASQRKMGRFEIAHGGTLFLDEIGELEPSLQTKLLRVLQEGELQRVGGTETLKVDVRVLAATNEDLVKATQEGRFRSDLFYRLNVFPIEIPPLRERREDIPFLVWHFVNRHATALRKTIDQIPQSLMEAFKRYSWPGNVRELENLIERAVILTPGSLLQIDESIGVGTLGMTSPVTDTSSNQVNATSPQKLRTLEEAERDHVMNVLDACGWKVSGKGGAAEILGVPESTLRNQMKRLGIERRPRQTTRSNSKT